jgi:hypothetical protein
MPGIWCSAFATIHPSGFIADGTKGILQSPSTMGSAGSFPKSTQAFTTSPITREFPSDLSPINFIRLTLLRGATTVSENFYWHPVQEGNYHALKALPKVKLESATHIERQGQRWVLKTGLKNASAQPALMVHLKVIRDKSGDRILPALYSDNFVSLMPGERRSIEIQIENADARGEKPAVVVQGFNIEK